MTLSKMPMFSKSIRNTFKALQRSKPIAGKQLDNVTFYQLPRGREVAFDVTGSLAYDPEIRTWDDGTHSINICIVPDPPGVSKLRLGYIKAASFVHQLLNAKGDVKHDAFFTEQYARFTIKCDEEGKPVKSDKGMVIELADGSKVNHSSLVVGDHLRIRALCSGAVTYTGKNGEEVFKLSIHVRRIIRDFHPMGLDTDDSSDESETVSDDENETTKISELRSSGEGKRSTPEGGKAEKGKAAAPTAPAKKKAKTSS